MIRLLISVFAMLLLVLPYRLVATPLNPNDQFVQQFDLSMTQYSFVETSPLQIGEPYYLIVSGVYGYAHYWSWMDGAYCWGICDPVLARTTYTDTGVWYWNGLDNQIPSPPDYNPQHVYVYYFTGTGNTETFLYSDPGSYWDNSGGLHFEIWHPEAGCLPTEPVYLDEFSTQSLDSCWFWTREDASQWSLTSHPGWMRLMSVPGDVNWNEATTKNKLTRIVPDTDWFIETKLDFEPQQDNGAGLFVALDDRNHLNIRRQTYGGIRSHVFDNDYNTAYADLNETWNPVYLRIEKLGNQYSTFASPDGSHWTLVAMWVRDFAFNGTLRVGINAYRYSESPSYPADFDYFLLGSDLILPVNLITFEAEGGLGAILVRWATGSEHDVSHFELTRNGVLIYQEPATNNSSGHQYEWVDLDVDAAGQYLYELSSVDLDGSRAVLGTASASPLSGAMPKVFALQQNYPNPFNAETTIRFELGEASEITLAVFNVVGQEVYTLANGNFAAGSHAVAFDASGLTTGVYLYRLTVGPHVTQRKMLLLK